MENLFDVQDKVILLTGGCGILASSMARYFAAKGAKIVVLDRLEDKGNELVAELKAKGGEAAFFYCDVLKKEVLEKCREDILALYGRIDVLVNAAGGNQAGATIAPDQTFFDLDMKAFGGVMNLNLIGTVLPTQVFAVPMTKQGKGVILNMSSETSLRPLTRVVGYGCAKSSINSFTKFMAGELAIKFGEGLRVNAIAPGFFLTTQNRELMTNPDGSPSDRCQKIVAHTPFGRLGQPEELLGTIHWLISDASAFVTGVVVPIDGGFDAFSI